MGEVVASAPDAGEVTRRSGGDATESRLLPAPRFAPRNPAVPGAVESGFRVGWCLDREAAPYCEELRTAPFALVDASLVGRLFEWHATLNGIALDSLDMTSPASTRCAAPHAFAGDHIF
ncbi:hypothetical protein AYO20_09917 [Fonsecaea nubica]|uniref:Uncharacterized protein n=1 Tax=Fonsecaea nubica TaxID=856822 RepID=A0A178CC10_9EURO|nr:hypothetical protein AYO20_09917 [Fonsecaea nubica]OAL26884.1 hypothetical protein AYO20_09917 [Fonsecaea nubica]